MRTLPLLALFSLVLLSACSGGEGGTISVIFETEPNSVITAADVMAFDRPYGGAIGAGDLDFWSFAATAGDLIGVELIATRLDQAGWDASCNTPQLTLFLPDQATKLLEHIVTSGWDFGGHDLDFPLFRAPTSGTYYLCVSANPGVAAAGDYALRITKSASNTVQLETEPAGGTGVNDSSASAQLVTPGLIYGNHVDGGVDFYKFTLTGAAVVVFETIAHRNGHFRGDGDYVTPELTLFGTNGTTEIEDEDETFFGDAQLCAHLAAAGTYFLRVSEAGGSGDGDYFLSFAVNSLAGAPAETEANDSAATADAIGYGNVIVGSFLSTDSDFFRFTGAAGDMVYAEVAPGDTDATVGIEFRASDGSTLLPSETDAYGGLRVGRTILTAGGTVFVRVTTTAGTAVSYALSLSRRFASRFETETNDVPVDADVFDNAGVASGRISTAGDVDLFRFGADGGQLVVASIYAAHPDTAKGGSDGFHVLSGHGSTLKPRLRILRNDGTPLAVSLHSPTGLCETTESIFDPLPTAAVAFVAPSDNTFYLEVVSEDGSAAATHHYLVRVRG